MQTKYSHLQNHELVREARERENDPLIAELIKRLDNRTGTLSNVKWHKTSKED